MERGFNILDMAMMPDNGTSVTLEDRMLIMDSLDQHDVNFDTEQFQARFPLKLATSCLVVVVSGKVQCSVNFRDFVATDNTCLFIADGTIIEKAVFDPHARVFVLSFSQHRVPSVSQISQRMVHRVYALQAVLLPLQDEHVAMLCEVYRLLRTILIEPAFACNREQTAANCLNLMASIIDQEDNIPSQVSSKPSRQDEIVARFLECVHQNYRDHRELGFYADKLCLSLKYMSHVIHEQTGRHPSQWIKDYVILDAKTMLRSGRYTVQQVAEELNFPNQSFFGKYFKEAVGVSPKKWK